MTNSGSLSCGASLITRDMILSAAHCWNTDEEILFNVYDLNQLDEEDGVQRLPIKEVFVHPLYVSRPTRYDVMIVQLDGIVTSIPHPVKLNSDFDVPVPGDVVTVMGFGDTAFGGSPSDILKVVDLEYVPNDVCRNIEDNNEFFLGITLTSDMMCAYKMNEDSCQGDSGSALVLMDPSQPDGTNDVQVGIVSTGVGCATEIPGVYSRIDRFYEWIEETVCEYSADTGPHFDCHPSSIPSTTPSTVPTTTTTEPSTIAPVASDIDIQTTVTSQEETVEEEQKDDTSNGTNDKKYNNILLFDMFMFMILLLPYLFY